jgi:uncharacterized protein (TIGR03435 family)
LTRAASAAAVLLCAGAGGRIGSRAAPDDLNPHGPDLFSALQQQLGLKLEEKKVAAGVLVVDHIEKEPAAR